MGRKTMKTKCKYCGFETPATGRDVCGVCSSKMVDVDVGTHCECKYCQKCDKRIYKLNFKK